MIIVCAWCDKPLDETPAEPRERVSHGICPECSAKEREQLNASRARRCPNCRMVELKPIPTRDGFLEHFRCSECRVIWAWYPTPLNEGGGCWIPCEDQARHLPAYIEANA